MATRRLFFLQVIFLSALIFLTQLILNQPKLVPEQSSAVAKDHQEKHGASGGGGEVSLAKKESEALAVVAVQNEEVAAVTSTAAPVATNNEEEHDECSCWNEFANFTCCERSIWMPHKHGHVLMQNTFRPVVKMRHLLTTAFRDWGDFPTKRDYRHVVITRNFVDALVSGYLYHKEGSECWIGINGGELKRGAYWWTVIWERYVKIPHTPGNGRNICEYLANSTTEEGLRVLVDWSMFFFYRNLPRYWQTADKTRVMHVCSEDAKNLIPQVTAHLFPGGYNFTTPEPAPLPPGHATATNHTYRNQLKEMVREMDRTIFNNSIAEADRLFGCR